MPESQNSRQPTKTRQHAPVFTNRKTVSSKQPPSSIVHRPSSRPPTPDPRAKRGLVTTDPRPLTEQERRRQHQHHGYSYHHHRAPGQHLVHRADPVLPHDLFVASQPHDKHQQNWK